VINALGIEINAFVNRKPKRFRASGGDTIWLDDEPDCGDGFSSESPSFDDDPVDPNDRPSSIEIPANIEFK